MTASRAVPRPAVALAPAGTTGFQPAQMAEVELAEPLPALGYDGRHLRVWILARLHGEPVGACMLSFGKDELGPDEVAALIWPELREAVTARFTAAGRPQPAGLSGQGLADADPAAWPFLRRRTEVLATAPLISVVICTRDRPEQLAICLRSVARQQYPRFEVVVVDNAPTTDAVSALVSARSADMACRYVRERRAGLSRARNAGIAAAAGDIIAFLDDDEEPDSQWLAGLACGFARGGDIGCVTGLVVPARLETPAQELFEQLGGHVMGRGFSAVTFSRHGSQSPLYPLPPFGVGANMAFRREALDRVGGFDVALGAGTPAHAGEDTLALTLVLLEGFRIAYEPAALMRHDHRRDLASLDRQLHGYGVGLTAYYTALLRHRAGTLPALLRLLPSIPGYLRSTSHPGQVELPPGVLARLMRRKRRGMLIGPPAYLWSLCRAVAPALRSKGAK